MFNWILGQTNYDITLLISRILQADFLAQFPSFPFVLRRSSSKPESTPPRSYPSSEDDCKSVYTERESSKPEVEQDDYEKDPNYTFTGTINLSFKPPVTQSSPRSPLRLIPFEDTFLNIPVSYTTPTGAPTTPVVKRRLLQELSLPPLKRANQSAL